MHNDFNGVPCLIRSTSITARILTGAMLTVLVLMAIACGSNNSSVSALADQQRGTSGFSLNMLSDPSIAGSTAKSYDLSTEDRGQEVVVSVNATGASNLKALYFEMTYDARHYRPMSVDASKAMGVKADLVCLQVLTEPGKLTYGQVLTNWGSQTGFTGNAAIASVLFKKLPAEALRTLSTAPDNLGSQSTLIWDSGTHTLSWYYRNTGDYNQNSQVGIDDLTPLGAHWLQAATPPPFPETSVLSVIDGEVNGLLNIGDLTPIGVNWGKSAAGGYNIYKSATLADYPSPPTGANGATADLLGNVAFNAATGTAADRKHFTFNVAAAVANDYYWVRPNDLAGGLGNNGIASTMADGKTPTVSSTVPADGAAGVALNVSPSATFSQFMDPATISAISFILRHGSTAVTGSVTYTGITATFRPAGELLPNTQYTATITTIAKNLAGVALENNYVWTFATGATPDTTSPTVSSTFPASAEMGVALNVKLTATFSEAMDPDTINTATFTLNRQGTYAVSGNVTYAGMTATFSPLDNLSPNAVYQATITTGSKDLAGNALETEYQWSFQTSDALDTTRPTVISSLPADGATNVSPGAAPSAAFSEAMDPLTISTLTFTLMNGAVAVPGNVTYLGNTATYTPLANLEADTLYTATITTGAKDVAGNALASDYVWTFTTAIVDLGAIDPFGSFGGGSGMTNQGIYTVVNGDIGTTGASTMITGFHDTGGNIFTETPLNIGQVNGTIFTAPPAPGNAVKFAIASQAAIDAQIAYNNLSPASMPGGIDPGAGQLGGLTLAPGIYQAAGGTFQITGSDLTLDAQGDANAVWVFQTASSLTVGDTVPRSVQLINGALAKNVYWYVGSAATINGAGGGTMVGTIIASAGVTFSTAGNVVLTVLNGRAIGLNASCTLVNTVINVPH
jgi:hypothetical protein